MISQIYQFSPNFPTKMNFESKGHLTDPPELPLNQPQAEYPQLMFSWRNEKKKVIWLPLLSRAMSGRSLTVHI